jgi:ribosomal-protein-alanine acetyltransferase
MTVRTIEPGDVDEVAVLLQKTIRGRGHTTAEGLLRDRSTEHWIGLCCEDAGTIQGAIVGQCVIEQAEIHEVAVEQTARRKGWGTRLVEAFVASARQRGATQCTLEVRAGNSPALDLYRTLGFQRCATRQAYYGDGEDAIVMMCTLEPLH